MDAASKSAARCQRRREGVLLVCAERLVRDGEGGFGRPVGLRDVLDRAVGRAHHLDQVTRIEIGEKAAHRAQGERQDPQEWARTRSSRRYSPSPRQRVPTPVCTSSCTASSTGRMATATTVDASSSVKRLRLVTSTRHRPKAVAPGSSG